MAVIVLVHGIAQEQKSADTLVGEWTDDLIGGVRNAGHDDLADRLRRRAVDDPDLIRMAFYGNVFLRPDQQGGASGELDSGQRELAEELATEFLHNASESTRPRDAGNATLALRALEHGPGDRQGVGAVAGRAVAALDGIPWLSRAGMHLGKVNRIVSQAVRYLTEPPVRDAAIASVLKHLGPETRVVVAHSLGSVVAYEALRERPQQLPLFLTLGSPLGLNAVVRNLRQPPAFPTGVLRWTNLAGRNDVVAARPQLTRIFDWGRPAGAHFESTYTVDNGAEPHTADFYLTKTTAGAAIAERLGAVV
ncbi:alpha/beta fold hydrolase [Actinoplanes subglobosus]|uniref:Alpha/beta fold hydrolase n=1 Tax=Actinoplanes subglobosus TaxID=1547892 RepID=A0ABV8IH29_9ACTN